jgi:energy-coupling factor transporter ATP-binding protein EcfA2
MIALNANVVLPQSEHVYIVGQTGSGKTTLVRSVYQQVAYAIVIDTKEDMRWEGYRVTKDPYLPLNKPGRYIFRPPKWWQGAQWDIWFREVMKCGGYYVYIDELHDLSLGHASVITAFGRFITKARGSATTVWGGSQRPRWLPKFMVTETRHKILFFVLDEDDRKYMANNMVRNKRGVLYQQIIAWDNKVFPLHSFVYSNSSTGAAYRFAPLRK